MVDYVIRKKQFFNIGSVFHTQRLTEVMAIYTNVPTTIKEKFLKDRIKKRKLNYILSEVDF